MQQSDTASVNIVWRVFVRLLWLLQGETAVARLYLPETNTSRHLVLAIANSVKVMDRHGSVSSISQRDEKWSRVCSRRYLGRPTYLSADLCFITDSLFFFFFLSFFLFLPPNLWACWAELSQNRPHARK